MSLNLSSAKNKNRAAVKFAANLRKIRLAKCSQAELGFASEIHPAYIGRIERAEINPPLTSVLKIAFALGVSISDLCEGIDEEDAFYDPDRNKKRKLPRLRNPCYTTPPTRDN